MGGRITPQGRLTIRDSKDKGKIGLCILSSAKKKPFLADPKFLEHNGFKVCDEAYGWRYLAEQSAGKGESEGVKYLPNVISVLRIAGSISLLFCDVTGWPFWVIYAFCGISDMVDGWMARKLQAETRTGAVLDSVADIIFVVCCAARLLQVLEIPVWLWTWAGLIVFIKIMNQISALFVYKRFCFPHTWANKMTGLLLFLVVPAVFWSVIPIAIVAVIATFAAVQEGHYIRTKRVF